jgi:hypothetical protein
VQHGEAQDELPEEDPAINGKEERNMSDMSVIGAFKPFTSSGAAARCVSVALLSLSVLQVGATTIPYKNFTDLLREADAVVSGRVASVESKYSGDKEIYTFVTLDQVQTLSGSYSAPTLTLRFLGGQVGNDIMHVAGSPAFKVDQNIVAFVHGNGRYMAPIVGWTQGVFRVIRDPGTGQQVISDHEGNRVFRLQGAVLIKEQTNQPEANIIGEGQTAVAGPQAQADAGAPDFVAPSDPGAQPGAQDVAGAAVIGEREAMSLAAFVAAIQNVPVSRSSDAVLRSVSLNDFGSVSNLDVGTGPKSPGQAQELALPQPSPAPAAQNQQD